jgi:hypothetical protein
MTFQQRKHWLGALPLKDKLSATKVAQVDHGICDHLHGVVVYAFPLKPQEKPLEFIFPGKNSLNCTKPFLKNCQAKHRLTTPLGFLAVPLVGRNIGLHPKIEDFLPVCPAIIYTIQAHDRTFEVYPDSPCYLP